MNETKRHLKVFLCRAHSDKEAVKALYVRLTTLAPGASAGEDDVDAWLDKEKLLPGQYESARLGVADS